MGRIIGTQKIVDLGGFPIDPEDYQALREGVRPGEIAIYLRLFNEHGFIRRVVIMSRLETLLGAWNLIEPMTDTVAARLMDKVFQTFSTPQPPSRNDQAIASTAIRILCLYYLPELRLLTTVPAENILGVILDYDDRRLKEYAYSQFSLDAPKGNVH